MISFEKLKLSRTMTVMETQVEDQHLSGIVPGDVIGNAVNAVLQEYCRRCQANKRMLSMEELAAIDFKHAVACIKDKMGLPPMFNMELIDRAPLLSVLVKDW